MSSIQAQEECPICMVCIDATMNCVTTECGHCFHASCLMTNVAHNGFGCPYCRAKMAEEVVESDDESEYETDSDSDSDSDSESSEVLDPFDDNDMLRGFRMFFGAVEGVEHEADDVEEEQANERQAEEQEQAQAQVNAPSIEYITRKLNAHVTYAELVTALMVNHEEFDECEAPTKSDNRIYGIIRSIISKYESPIVVPV